MDVPLPDGEGERGWRISYGRKVGQRLIEAGVVLEFGTDEDTARRLYTAKVREYVRSEGGGISTGSSSAGSYCRDNRSGKYVEMKRVRR